MAARVRSYDASDALKVPGVERVVEIPGDAAAVRLQAIGRRRRHRQQHLGGDAGAATAPYRLGAGPNADYDTTAYRAELETTAQRTRQSRAQQWRCRRCAAGRRQTCQRRLLCSASGACHDGSLTRGTAMFAQVAARCGRPTQNPQQARTTVAQVLGIDQTNVTVNVTLLGGGFGRKSKPDYVAEAALLARAVGAPIKVTWSREDDLAHDYYHAIAAQHLEGGLDATGKPIAWLHRTVFPSIASTFTADTVFGCARRAQPRRRRYAVRHRECPLRERQGRGACAYRLVSVRLQHTARLRGWFVRGRVGRGCRQGPVAIPARGARGSRASWINTRSVPTTPTMVSRSRTIRSTSAACAMSCCWRPRVPAGIRRCRLGTAEGSLCIVVS